MKRFRILVFICAVLLIGSSAFATQQLLPPRTAEPAAETAGTSGEVDFIDKHGIINAENENEEDKSLPLTAIESETIQPDENAAALPLPADENDKPEAAAGTAAAVAKTSAQPGPVVTNAVAAAGPPAPAASKAEAAAPEKKAPASPYSLKSPRNYTFVTKITVKNSGTANSGGIRLQIPLMAASSLYQVQKDESFSISPSEIQNQQGARIGVFVIDDLAPGAETVLELRYNITTSVIEFFSRYLPVASDSLPAVYMEPSKGVESDSQAIINLSSKLTQGMGTDWEMAEAITAWVAKNIIYDAAASNRNSGALQALQAGRGVCEDYAALSAALARAAGIPARIVYGYTDRGSRWPGEGAFNLSGFRHAWVEYYLQGRGWVPAEPTRSNSRLYFGTLPHNRYIAQNYNDISLKVNYKGGKLAVSWTDSLE
ncbi:MAG: transglutaminase domain-containing protein [Dethiobacter sp.]|jgi:hypothetical protein|nr:transglutaminase domain-containing protein [Dethiobacter sp.]